MARAHEESVIILELTETEADVLAGLSNSLTWDSQPKRVGDALESIHGALEDISVFSSLDSDDFVFPTDDDE